MADSFKEKYPYPYEVKVTHQLGFFSFYSVHAPNSADAEKEAKKLFINDYCSNPAEPGLETYTIDKIMTEYKNRVID